MARQSGDIKLTGEIDGICFYEMKGKHYARMKSALTSRRFWKTKEFENSRKSCERFGLGNKLASKAYACIPKEQQKYADFCMLKTQAIGLVKMGLLLDDINTRLRSTLKHKSQLGKGKKNGSKTGNRRTNDPIKSDRLIKLPYFWINEGVRKHSKHKSKKEGEMIIYRGTGWP